MVIKMVTFVFIVLTFSIMGTTISSVSAEIDNEKITKTAERIARRDKMIADLKAEYAAKVAVKKAEATKTIIEKKVEATEVADKKVIEAEAVITEKVSEVKEAVESVSEHGK